MRGMNDKIRVYPDNCCFNRPFDEQTQDRIILETEAKIKIQAMIKTGIIDLVWSYILDYENSENPFEMKRISIEGWKSFSAANIEETEKILKNAEQITQYGIDDKDAIHIACAIEGRANSFLTTDIKLVKKSEKIKRISVCNPVQFFMIYNMEG